VLELPTLTNKGGFMVNVGLVVYTKGKMPGVLNSRWCESAPCWGTGLATGGPAEGFVGRYTARYFDESGAEKIIFELVIEKSGEIYALSWLIDGAIRLTGIGMEVNQGLAAGFRPID
jgi:hypothetical protein